MYMSYSLTRSFDYDLSTAYGITVDGDDAINCAHMLAAGFNTMSRNMMGDFVIGVVDTKTGSVQYDGKIEKFDRPDPHTVSTSFKFEGSLDPDNMVTIFDNENGRLMFPGKFKFPEPSKYEHVSREVLEAAYAELQAVKEVLADAGVETIPADRGVTDLRAVLRARDLQISELVQERANANAAARAELIKYVRGAYLKKERLTVDEVRQDLEDRFRGVLDVFAKFLVVTGEADASEGHAVARRLCGISDE